MQRRTIIISLAFFICGIGGYLFRPESLFVKATVNDLVLLILSAL